MQHNAYGVPQGGQVVVPHVVAADLHGALGGVVQAGDQLDQRGLGRAGAADDAHGRPGGDVQRNVGQGTFLCRSVILEADALEVDLTVRHSLQRIGGIGQVGLLGQHLTDAAGAGQRAGHLQKRAGEHHDRVEHLQNVAQKGGQLADAHVALQDEPAAEPHDADDGCVHDGLERGQVEHGVTEGLGAGVAQLSVDGAELLVFIIAAHERFNGADGGEGFLDAAVQVVDSALLAAVQRADLAHDERQQNGQNRRCDEENNRQLGAEQKCHAQTHGQHDRAAHKGAQACVDGVEQHGGIGGHAGDEGSRGKMVQVGKVEFLHGGVLGQAQLGRKAVGEPGGIAGIQQAGDQCQHRAECHQPALPQDDRHVMAGHTLVHQGGHQHGDDHLKDTFNKDQPGSRPKVPAVGLAIAEN